MQYDQPSPDVLRLAQAIHGALAPGRTDHEAAGRAHFVVAALAHLLHHNEEPLSLTIEGLAKFQERSAPTTE
jgi:hypothetical protein